MQKLSLHMQIASKSLPYLRLQEDLLQDLTIVRTEKIVYYSIIATSRYSVSI